jgi:predicted extracellular nuclease
MFYKNSVRGMARLAAVISLSALSALSAFAQREYPIHAIQGDKNVSPYERQMVKTTGIVTARVRNGFFIQTPDDKTDNNPATSEGLFIFTRNEPRGEAAIGNLVSVTGQVTEFRPNAEPMSLPITQIVMQQNRDMVQVLSKDNPLPKPIVLTRDDMKQGTIDELERFEGMRVTVAEMTVTQPTGARIDTATDRATSNGVFYGIIKGMPRAFREPGYNIYDLILLPEKEKNDFRKNWPKMPIFNSNPHVLRVESMSQLGSEAIDVASQTELRNVTGVMYYAFRSYAILTDPNARPAVSSTIKPTKMPAPNDTQFSVSGMNIQDFFDDEDDPSYEDVIFTSQALNARFRKMSAAIRLILNSPDVIGVVEAENQAVLKRFAERLNSDTVAAGGADPKYDGWVVKGNDGRGINVGFLVKTSKINVIEIKQFGKDEKYTSPTNKEQRILNDRPPLMLKASFTPKGTETPFEFYVVVNHLKSFLGYNDPKRQDDVRMKKRLQAEFLAKWVQSMQTADPNAKIILVGDFNAYQFNDGIVDVIGAIKGTPAPRDQVMNPSEDLVNPDMVNLVDLIAADQRYSYHFDGNAQVLDHIIVSQSLRPYIHGFGYGRLNTDFPKVYRNDTERLESFSDHDPAIAYFNTTPRAPRQQ